jgi:hypothetical protein
VAGRLLALTEYYRNLRGGAFTQCLLAIALSYNPDFLGAVKIRLMVAVRNTRLLFLYFDCRIWRALRVGAALVYPGSGSGEYN